MPGESWITVVQDSLQLRVMDCSTTLLDSGAKPAFLTLLFSVVIEVRALRRCVPTIQAEALGQLRYRGSAQLSLPWLDVKAHATLRVLR
jgi:hypothetical protein